MTITVSEKLMKKNGDILSFIKVNHTFWLQEAKESFESKELFSRGGWRYDAYKKRVYATKKLKYMGLLDTKIEAYITYNGKRFYVKIVEEKGERK